LFFPECGRFSEHRPASGKPLYESATVQQQGATVNLFGVLKNEALLLIISGFGDGASFWRTSFALASASAAA
jgi:hypothetical protein